MWLSLFKKSTLPERQRGDDPFNIDVKQGIEKYGSATKLMEAMFESGRDFITGNPVTDVMFLYLKEQHFKNMDDGK